MRIHGIASCDRARSQCAEQLAELAAAAGRLAVIRAAAAAEASGRNELIADLRAAGLPWSEIAAAARLSITQCVTIAAVWGAS